MMGWNQLTLEDLSTERILKLNNIKQDINWLTSGLIISGVLLLLTFVLIIGYGINNWTDNPLFNVGLNPAVVNSKAMVFDGVVINKFSFITAQLFDDIINKNIENHQELEQFIYQDMIISQKIKFLKDELWSQFYNGIFQENEQAAWQLFIQLLQSIKDNNHHQLFHYISQMAPNTMNFLINETMQWLIHYFIMINGLETQWLQIIDNLFFLSTGSQGERVSNSMAHDENFQILFLFLCKDPLIKDPAYSSQYTSIILKYLPQIPAWIIQKTDDNLKRLLMATNDPMFHFKINFLNPGELDV